MARYEVVSRSTGTVIVETNDWFFAAGVARREDGHIHDNLRKKRVEVEVTKVEIADTGVEVEVTTVHAAFDDDWDQYNLPPTIILGEN